MYEQKEKKDKKERRIAKWGEEMHSCLGDVRWLTLSKQGVQTLFYSPLCSLTSFVFKNSPFQMHKLIHLLVLKLD